MIANLKSHEVLHFESVFEGPSVRVKFYGESSNTGFFTNDAEHLRQIIKDFERAAQYLEGEA